MANAIYFLSTSFVRAVEETMDWYDHLAFTFLLSKRGDELIAIKWMQQLIWLREQGSSDWKRVAVNFAIQSAGMNPNAVTEALFQLKQWKLLCLIGYSIPTPISFIPTGHLCPFRLGLFGILDQLDYNLTRILISDMMSGNYAFQATEIVALQWISNGTVSADDCSKLTIGLARLGRSDLAILSLQLQNGVGDRAWNNSTSFIDNPMGLNQTMPSPPRSDETCLEFSPSSSGYCLIVHQKNYYQERDPMLKNRVEHDIPDYSGNEVDCRLLRQTFLALGYKVEVVENLTNFDLKQKVLDVSRQVDWSLHNSLALCFLSHCIQGRILGCNSLSISFNQDVRKLFNECHCPGLKGKHKAFIFITPIGSVGRNMISPFDSVGFNRKLYDNFLILWPTTYALSRSTNGGSEFITELCAELTTQDVPRGIKSLQTAISIINNRNSFSRYGSRRQIWSIDHWSV